MILFLKRELELGQDQGGICCLLHACSSPARRSLTCFRLGDDVLEIETG